MKKRFFVACAVSASLSFMASATTVTWAALPAARTVTLEDGITTVTSGFVMTGYFATPGGISLNSGQSFAQNVSGIMASGGWKQFTLDPATGLPDGPQSTSSTLTITGSGKIGGAVTDNNGSAVPTSTGASFFDGKPVYLWVFNGVSVAASTQMGIFTATAVTNPNPSWIFPTNANGLSDGINLSTTSTGSAATTIAAIGGVGTTPAGKLQLVSTVPEPSTLAFCGIAGASLTFVRRRQRK